jgi:hypothetical protein
MAGIGWLMLGRNASTEEIKLVAHLAAFVCFMGALAWAVSMPFWWYIRLSAAVRQAEAD